MSFSVGRGETLGIVGESGCGKSTTGYAIQGLVKRQSGNIRIGDRELGKGLGRDRQLLSRRVQMVFQDPTSSLNAKMTVGQILTEPLAVHNIVPPRERAERVGELLEMVGMPRSSALRFPHEFSGGQRQRIGIARALAVEPELIICDEPTAALDVSVRAQVLNLLRRLQKERGLSLIFISHDVSAVTHMADRIMVMYLGRAVEVLPRAALLNRSAHPYTQALLSAVPVPDPLVEKNRERILLRGDVPSPINPPSGCVFRTRCPIAQEICAIDVPKQRVIGKEAEGQTVACHFAEEVREGGIAALAASSLLAPSTMKETA
ncbi:oligopeptide ABC transporter ATP-binding protein OppF [Microterricola pindariensis]|uniref:Oligopeptide ABC transporter ATP-binding protein OppF n=1 Tax=Microterricola pindariensis TaxID=478010 RepID=A0ABX5AZ97_9MICO|nr:oligopeptide ABC transporter ATP-binding protein OppF [Microterricola pindariensis]